MPGWQELESIGPEVRVLRLPADGVRDGGILRLPDGDERYDHIHVDGVRESFGAFEPFLSALVARLAPGGKLHLDVLNEQSPSVLRTILEGRPNGLDPLGSFGDPDRPLSVTRLLEAVDSARGLLVEDLLRLPHPDGVDPGQGVELVRDLIRHGLMASAYAGGLPSMRLWLCARAVEDDARPGGSVVVGPGSPEEVAETEKALEGALAGTDWEVIRAPDEAEHVAFNRGVRQATGRKVWFLRAGARPTAATFAALRAEVTFGPACGRSSSELERASNDGAIPGDVAGILIDRRDLMRIGPIDERWHSAHAAYEDYGMRLIAQGLHVREFVWADAAATCEQPAIPVPVERLDTFRVELEKEFGEVVARWDGVGAAGEATLTTAFAPRATAPEAPWAGRTPRVSLCMIARDEERYLDECLRRAAPAVDEIVILDTGSTDRTIEIARSHGARVVERAWTDDFAAARNAGLKEVTGDWILVLDADEFLDDGAAERIRQITQDPGACGFHMRFTNVYGDEKSIGVTMVRLFRNLDGLEWQNRIHEQVTPSLMKAARRLGLTLSTADVHVLHYGYQPEVMEGRGKLERNLRLFELQLRDHPDDVYTLYKYGDFLRRCPGRDADARATLEQAFELMIERFPSCPRNVPYAGEIAALCALEYAREDRYERAEEILEIAFTRFMATPNLHYIAGGIALRRGREHEALRHYRQCLRYRGQTLVVPIQEGITGHVSIVGMAQAKLQLGDFAEARRLLETARELAPDYEVGAMVLSRLQLQQGDLQAALRTLTEFMNVAPDSAGVHEQLALILAQLGYPEQARRVSERAAALLDEKASAIEAERIRTKMAALAGAP